MLSSGLRMFVFTTLATGFWTGAVRAQTVDTEGLPREARLLYQIRQSERAIPIADRYARLIGAKLGADHPQYRRALANLAVLHDDAAAHIEASVAGFTPARSGTRNCCELRCPKHSGWARLVDDGPGSSAAGIGPSHRGAADRTGFRSERAWRQVCADVRPSARCAVDCARKT